MILTITPNPTVDRTLIVRGFTWGAAMRAEREVVVASGKGVGTSLVIHELGGETVALGLRAGRTGELHAALLAEMGVAADLSPALGETRTAVVLVDADAGHQSTISAHTLRADRSHLAALFNLLDRHAPAAWGVVMAGSLPPGLPDDTYAQLLRRAHRHGLTTLLDTSGGALRRGIAGCPDVLKVNRRELTALDGRMSSNGKTALAALADALRARLGKWARRALVVTLGSDGALAVTAEGCYHAIPPSVPVVSTAGAGDALSGGLMLALSRGAGWAEALAHGTAAAAAVVTTGGTAICTRERVESLRLWVQVERL